jgi:hypothetical protein
VKSRFVRHLERFIEAAADMMNSDEEYNADVEGQAVAADVLLDEHVLDGL